MAVFAGGQRDSSFVKTRVQFGLTRTHRLGRGHAFFGVYGSAGYRALYARVNRDHVQNTDLTERSTNWAKMSYELWALRAKPIIVR